MNDLAVTLLAPNWLRSLFINLIILIFIYTNNNVLQEEQPLLLVLEPLLPVLQSLTDTTAPHPDLVEVSGVALTSWR